MVRGQYTVPGSCYGQGSIELLWSGVNRVVIVINIICFAI